MAEDATETTEAPTESPTSFGGGEAEAPAPQAPDVSEQMQALRDEWEGFRNEIEETRYEPEEEGLLGYDEYGNPVYEEDDEDPEAYEGDPEEMDPEQALAAFVDQRAQEIAQAAVAPIQEQREMERRADALSEFAEQYQLPRDDSGAVEREAVDAIAQRLHPVAEQYGPGVYTDPELVKAAWLAHVAEQESASEVPAEEAMRAGAVLETGAGPGNSRAAQSEEDQIKREILRAGGSNSNWV